MHPTAIHGRGAVGNPVGRFEPLEIEYEPAEPNAHPTKLYRDTTRNIIAFNDSPDVNFDASVNPYRGCEHGCVYCYARPTHEYLGLSAGLDFETRIFVKHDAPDLLRRELAAPGWQPQLVALSGVTDAYQPVERKLELTRRCLQVFADFRNPVGIITKNELVTRDIDILQDLAAHDAIDVRISITSLDKRLADRMEPRASRPRQRLRAVETLARSSIRVGIMIGPVVPGLNDHEISDILRVSADAGASSASYILLRLPLGVKELFADWLDAHYPHRKDKVLNRVRDTRGGDLYDSSYGTRMRGEGEYADQIERMFPIAQRRYDLDRKLSPLSTAHFRNPEGQLELGL